MSILLTSNLILGLLISTKLLSRLRFTLELLFSNTFKLCFGSSALLSQRPGNYLDKFRLTDSQKVYSNLSDWKKDWDLSRNNIWISIGKKTKPQGNSEIQYYPDTKKLRLRLTEKESINKLKLISNDLNIPFDDLNNNQNIKYSQYRMKYNKMLTQFAKLQFSNLIKRKSERLNMKLYLVNPSYSSIGGFIKYGLINKLPVDIAASLWLARQSMYGNEFKQENHVKYIKKHNEDITFPYFNLSKQSKRENLNKLEWKDISSALGKDRKSWYENTMILIKLKVDESLLIQNNPFELNQTGIS